MAETEPLSNYDEDLIDSEKPDAFRSYQWVFTSFQDEPPTWDDKTMKGLMYAPETCPTTGKAHWQGWIWWKNNKSRSATSKALGNVWCACPRGDYKAQRDYIEGPYKKGKKEKPININFKQWGDMPDQGKRSDLLQIQEQIDNGVSERVIAEENFATWCQYGKRFTEYRKLKRIWSEEPRNWVPEVIVIWGAAGTGKSRIVHEENKEVDDISVTPGGFLIGYHGAATVLFDDFDDNMMQRKLFLNLLDRYPLTVNVKNGEMNWNPKRIYITSNFDPRTWYVKSQVYDEKNEPMGDPAVMRRITSVTELN